MTGKCFASGNEEHREGYLHLRRVQSKCKYMEMNFGINLFILMDQSLVVFWESFLSLPSFGVKNAKKTTFLKMNGFSLKF